MNNDKKIELSFFEKISGNPICALRVKIKKNGSDFVFLRTNQQGRITISTGFKAGDKVDVCVEKITGDFKEIASSLINEEDLELILWSFKSKIVTETDLHTGVAPKTNRNNTVVAKKSNKSNYDLLDKMSTSSENDESKRLKVQLGQTRSAGGHPKIVVEVSRPEPVSTTDTSTDKLIPDLLFPLEQRPEESYKTGARRFGSNRSKGRKHAGVDLYAPIGTPIRAMADGTVINAYHFYRQTYAIEIEHKNFVARYGEVQPKTIKGKIGEIRRRGQIIAYVGQLEGIDYSMLHLEMYGTTKNPATQALTQPEVTPYQRRADLIDPTSSLDCAQMN